MDIAGRVKKRKEAFEVLTGVKPKSIYLGRREVVELKNFYLQALNIIQEPEYSLKAFGIEIVQVEKEYHIGVGI